MNEALLLSIVEESFEKTAHATMSEEMAKEAIASFKNILPRIKDAILSKFINPSVKAVKAGAGVTHAAVKAIGSKTVQGGKDVASGAGGAVKEIGRRIAHDKSPLSILREMKTGDVHYLSKLDEPSAAKRIGWNAVAGTWNVGFRGLGHFELGRGALLAPPVGGHAPEVGRYIFNKHGFGADLDVLNDYRKHIWYNKIRPRFNKQLPPPPAQEIVKSAFLDELEKIAISRRAIKHIAHGAAALGVGAHVGVEYHKYKKYKKK